MEDLDGNIDGGQSVLEDPGVGEATTPDTLASVISVTMPDGSVLEVTDVDIDGNADMHVQSIADGYILTANPGPDQTVFQLDLDGNVVTTGVDIDADMVIDFEIPVARPDVFEPVPEEGEPRPGPVDRDNALLARETAACRRHRIPSRRALPG